MKSSAAKIRQTKSASPSPVSVSKKRAQLARGKVKTQKEKAPQLLTRKEAEAVIVAHAEHGERLARSFLNRWRVKMHPGEITSVVGVALCEAANRFDKSKKVNFKTFFFYHLRGMLIKEIIRLVEEQRITQLVPQPSTPDKKYSELALAEIWPLPVVEAKTPETMCQKNQLAQICWEVCAKLDSLEQDVVLRFFVFDQPLNVIAKELGYCRCHISRVKSRALAILSRALRQRLPDYRSSVFHHDPLPEDFQTERQVVNLRKYKGGRGRRKVTDEQGSNILPFPNIAQR